MACHTHGMCGHSTMWPVASDLLGQKNITPPCSHRGSLWVSFVCGALFRSLDPPGGGRDSKRLAEKSPKGLPTDLCMAPSALAHERHYARKVPDSTGSHSLPCRPFRGVRECFVTLSMPTSTKSVRLGSGDPQS